MAEVVFLSMVKWLRQNEMIERPHRSVPFSVIRMSKFVILLWDSEQTNSAEKYLSNTDVTHQDVWITVIHSCIPYPH